MRSVSVRVLEAFWNELLVKWERNESDDILRVLSLIEKELQIRRDESCSH